MFSYSIVSLAVAWLVVECAKAEVDSDAVTRAVLFSARTAHIADFEDVARQYVFKKGREYKRRVSWWDLHAKHAHFKKHPEYNKYKINVSVDRVKYGTVRRRVDRPGYAYAQWFHNSQSTQIIEGQMSRQKEQQKSFSWSVEQGVKTGMSITTSSGVPGVFESSASFNAEISLSATHSNTETEVETFTISNIIKISPRTSVKAEWIITEREMEIAWEADVHINGYVAMWFDKKHNGHWLWFHPVWFLATGPFKRASDGGLVYRAKGTFTGVRGLETTLTTYEYPLQKSIDLKYAAVPRNVTVLQRTVVSPFRHED